MSRIHEPLQRHIHGQMCHEVNEFIIALKIHYADLSNEREGQEELIKELRKRHPKYTFHDVIEFLNKIHGELYSCTKPFRIH